MDFKLKSAEQIFGRCQTCLRNMQLAICSFTCSPQHSRYLTPTIATHVPDSTGTFFESAIHRKAYLFWSYCLTEIEGGEDAAPIQYVESVQFEISEKYVSGVYESCSNVIVPSTGGYAMDLACGAYDSKTCTPKRWYQFMGDAVENMYVPFLINYTYTNPAKAFTAQTKKCNETYEVSAMKGARVYLSIHDVFRSASGIVALLLRRLWAILSGWKRNYRRRYRRYRIFRHQSTYRCIVLGHRDHCTCDHGMHFDLYTIPR